MSPTAQQSTGTHKNTQKRSVCVVLCVFASADCCREYLKREDQVCFSAYQATKPRATTTTMTTTNR
ncbi:hypothetical protein PMAC_001584 [Pneumocystis sp. 'macacae']|nr:hypothetical protein PMAC_001584 [Pneumocystis sp. 'macacae']